MKSGGDVARQRDFHVHFYLAGAREWRPAPAFTAMAACCACWLGLIGMAGCSFRDRFPLMAAFRSMTEGKGVRSCRSSGDSAVTGRSLQGGQGKSGADTYLGVLAGCARSFLVVKSSISSDVLL